MSEKIVRFQYCDQIISDFEKVCKHPIVEKSSVYYTGVDLGTACVVVAVLDENFRPVAGAYQYADVVRDGMVVDYFGAVQIIREMKAKLEEALGVEELLYAAAAIPPGTDTLDGGAVKNVVQGAGFELTNLLDESTAANAVIRIKNGAIVKEVQVRMGERQAGHSYLTFWKSIQYMMKMSVSILLIQWFRKRDTETPYPERSL